MLAAVAIALLLTVLNATGGLRDGNARRAAGVPAGQAETAGGEPRAGQGGGSPVRLGDLRPADLATLPDNLRAEVGNLRQRFSRVTLTAYDGGGSEPGTMMATVAGADAGTRGRAWTALDSLRRQAGVTSPGTTRQVGDLLIDCTDPRGGTPGSCLLSGPRGVGLLMSWTIGTQRLASLATEAHDRISDA